MGFIEDAVSYAKGLASSVGDFTGGVVDYSKLKVAGDDLSRKINRSYKCLGKLYYDTMVSDVDNRDRIQEQVDSITDMNIELDILRAKMNYLKDKVKCDKCGAINTKDAVFCNKCGAKIETKINFDTEVVEEVEVEVEEKDSTNDTPTAEASDKTDSKE